MTVIMILAVAVTVMAFQNRRLSLQIAALCDRQEQTEQKINRLSRKAKKQTSVAKRQEAKIEKLHRKAREQALRQARIEREQTKQAEKLRKAEHKLSIALQDIDSQETRLSQLFAVMDCLKAQQTGVMPGSSADIRIQRQIIVVENQVAAAERRIAQARYNEQEARHLIAA